MWMKGLMMVMAAGMVAVVPAGATSLRVADASVAQETMAVSGTPLQVKDDLFAGAEKFAKGASDVNEVNLDKDMLGTVNANTGDAGRMDFMVVRNYTYDKPGMYRMEDVEEYLKKLEDGSWHCSVRVRNKEGATDICSRPGKDNETNEMVIVSAEPKELSLIHMKGRGNMMNMGGMAAKKGLNKRDK